MIVEPETDLGQRIDYLLARPEIDFVISRNVLAGCYSFTAERAQQS